MTSRSITVTADHNNELYLSQHILGGNIDGKKVELSVSGSLLLIKVDAERWAIDLAQIILALARS